ncbi:MAG: diguanylate cyclase [Proteobacteria bacterium]|nr:diguanylate cyclase [Pseudomonadota bacterium]
MFKTNFKHYRRAGARWLRLAPLALLLWSAGTSAWAVAPMRFENFGLDAGLSELAVNAIAQDSSGFLWVGTEDGLDRYDGYRFVHFTHDSTSPQSVPENFIADLCFDASGNLWIATEGGGVAVRYAGHNAFRSLTTLVQPDEALKLENARVIRADRAGVVWIGTRDQGLAIFDRRTGSMYRYSHEAATPRGRGADAISSLAESRDGGMWIGSESGVERLLSTGLSGTGAFRIARQVKVAGVRSLLEDRSGTLWIGTEHGLSRLRAGSIVAEPVGLREPGSAAIDAVVETLFEDRAQRLWIGTDQGLGLLDAGHGELMFYRGSPGDSDGLPDPHVISIFEDRSGLLWIGTKFGGLAKWNPRSWSFGHRRPEVPPALSSRNVMSFTETADGRVWIGTMGSGLIVSDRQGKVLNTMRDSGAGGPLSDGRIMALLTDRHDVIWAGTMAGGLERISPRDLSVKHYRNERTNRHALPSDGVMSLFEDSRGTVWVGTFGGGLSRYDPSLDGFITYGDPSGAGASGGSGRITAIAEDLLGRIWTGTDGDGIGIVNPVSGKLQNLQHDVHGGQSISSNTIYSLYCDPRGVMWVGTRAAGIDATTEPIRKGAVPRFANLSERDGLPNNSVYGILPDTTGGLWLSTNHGLARLEVKSRQFISFRRSQGLQADEFNFGAHYRGRGGRLFFGGPNGYNAFVPRELETSSLAPPVVLTGISASGRPVETNIPFDSLPAARFGYQDRVVTFDFAALDFTSPAANRFEYKLDGFDHDWIAGGERASATYTQLPGGNYTFRVRAANSEGIWNEQGRSLAVTMDPPPWKTAYAYAVYSAAAAGLLVWLWLRRRRELAAATALKAHLEEQVRVRTVELAQKNSQLQRANQLLESASHTDPLTGLGNRRCLDAAVGTLTEGLLNEWRRDPQAARLALLLIDLDRLKPINDQLGHQAGDRLLQEVSAILKECVHDDDRIVRWGGDEFVIVHRLRDLRGAAVLAERIRHRVSKRKFQLGGSQVGRTSCSIGFALFPFAPGRFEPLAWDRALAVADANMYLAKKRRNAWVGCAAVERARDQKDLELRAQSNLDELERAGIVEVCRSEGDLCETVELLLRRPAGVGHGRHE